MGVLRLPGGGELVLASEYQTLALLDQEGTLMGSVSTREAHSSYAAGTPLVVPLDWWHLLRPRDEAGSAALRAVSTSAVEKMLAAALAELEEDGKESKPSLRDRLTSLVRGDRDDLARTVANALPGLTHPGLLAGVLDVVRRAAKQLRTFRGYAPIAAAARAVDLASLVPSGPAVTEGQLNTALGWFGGYRSSSDHGSTPTTLPELVTALAQTAALPKAEGRALPETTCSDWFEFLPALGALAHRAASPLTSDEHREALVMLLRHLADSGMAEGDGHWRTVGFVLPKGAADPKDRVVPVAGGFIAVFEENGGTTAATATTGSSSPAPPAASTPRAAGCWRRRRT